MKNLNTIIHRIKNAKGLTLIELLAVVVILAIVSAIAVPSIAKLIDNSKTDAHVANAEQMVNAINIARQDDQDLATSRVLIIPLGYLIDKGYLEKMKDPDNGGGYIEGEKEITIAHTENDYFNWLFNTNHSKGSYAVVYDGKITALKLVNQKTADGKGKSRGIQTKFGTAITYYDSTTKEYKKLSRSDVNPTP